jgi:hypothetical protein
MHGLLKVIPKLLVISGQFKDPGDLELYANIVNIILVIKIISQLKAVGILTN